MVYINPLLELSIHIQLEFLLPYRMTRSSGDTIPIRKKSSSNRSSSPAPPTSCSNSKTSIFETHPFLTNNQQGQKLKQTTMPSDWKLVRPHAMSKTERLRERTCPVQDERPVHIHQGKDSLVVHQPSPTARIAQAELSDIRSYENRLEINKHRIIVHPAIIHPAALRTHTFLKKQVHKVIHPGN